MGYEIIVSQSESATSASRLSSQRGNHHMAWTITIAIITAFAGYVFGEQSAYRSLRYGSENAFASVRYWFESWFPNTHYRLEQWQNKRRR